MIDFCLDSKLLCLAYFEVYILAKITELLQ